MSAATVNPFELLSLDADADFTPVNAATRLQASAPAAQAANKKAAASASSTKNSSNSKSKKPAAAPSAAATAAASAAGVPPKPVTARADTRPQSGPAAGANAGPNSAPRQPRNFAPRSAGDSQYPQQQRPPRQFNQNQNQEQGRPPRERFNGERFNGERPPRRFERPAFAAGDQQQQQPQDGTSLEHAREPRQDSAPHQRRAPAHGRTFDRHSGTGRFDGQKKDFAGHGWGKMTEVPDHVTAEQALKIDHATPEAAAAAAAAAASSKPAYGGEKNSADAVVASPEEKVRTFDEFLKSRTKGKSKAKSNPRKVVEPVNVTEIKDDSNDPSFGLMAVDLSAENVNHGQRAKKNRSTGPKRITVEGCFMHDMGAGSSRGPRPPRRENNNRNNGEERPAGNRGPRREFNRDGDERRAPRPPRNFGNDSATPATASS